MARKGKIGLDYFSHDVHMRSDARVRFIKAKHGFIAYGIYNALLEEIYSNGYFIENGEKFNILFSDENKIDLNVFRNVLNDCINEGLFDEGIYKKYGILTSRRIQLNYIAGSERRNAIEFIKQYLLIEPENEINDKYKDNVIILELNADIITENDNKSTQKKKKVNRKESKEYINLQDVEILKLTQSEYDKLLLKENNNKDELDYQINQCDLWLIDKNKKTGGYRQMLNWLDSPYRKNKVIVRQKSKEELIEEALERNRREMFG